MPKRKKIIVAGGLILETIYPAIYGGEHPKVRAEKKKLSSEAQQRMNQKYSWQKLELMLAANFIPGDHVCGVTYDDEHLPATRTIAEGRLKRFRADLAKCWKLKGKKLVMFWCTEELHGIGRLHHHLVINAAGSDDYADIARIWGQGEVDIKPLRVDREKNYETLARYMTKEKPERLGARGWSYTRTAVKPEIETFVVDDDTPLQVPSGAMMLEEASETTAYGSFRYIKYYARNIDPRKRIRAKRRRRK